MATDVKTKTDPERVPRSRLSGAARRERFLDMAAEIIVESGLSAVTMESVASRSNVDKRLGYRYFTNRDDLIGALVEREFEVMRQRVHQELPVITSFEERLRVNTRLWLATIAERGPLLRRLLCCEGPHEHYASTVLNTAVADWAAMIATETGLHATVAEAATRMLLAALSGAVEVMQTGLKPLDEVADLYSTIALAGIRAVAQRARADDLHG
ncbi:MAG TPA: TetR/AcrR family transcriptional regulator [Caballeronia sp.]|nr:TetR/AcrR family transcriptional regulator [Caballeronia sp.]